MKKNLFRGNLFLLLIAVMLFSTSCGKNKATTMKLIKTDGEVGVENEKGKSVDLIENLGLYNGYNIDTQTKSFAWIDLDDTKLTKMDEKSDVDITKDGKKLELVVNSGGLFFNVTKPLEDDESMDIRTSTTICGIRGTCGWVESHGGTFRIGLLDGKVESSVMADGKEETVKINAKELLIVKKDGDNVTYKVRELTYKDVPGFVRVEIADEPFALEEETYTVDDDFIGTFMNGNNKGAGRFTVTEVNLQSANVRLEAFRTVDDNDFSIVFESVGHPFEDGIYMDVSGQRVEFIKGTQRNGMQNYILNVPEELKQAWNFYLEYENEYVLVEEGSKEKVDIKNYIGTFINGQDVDSGTLTITEIDPQSVNVRLEAFRTLQAGEFSTIFEEVGYPFENGIYVDVSGQRVEIRKQNHSINGHNYDGYILDVPETLKQDWDIALNYEREYLDTAEPVDIKDYIGTFMNGEDSGAGRLTISEIDPQSVNVRFEACRNFGNDNGFSLVFEGTGYPFENGIYIDVSGQRIEFTKGTQRLGAQSYVLYVSEPLKQEWELLESVYEMEYILEEKWREYYSGLDY